MLASFIILNSNIMELVSKYCDTNYPEDHTPKDSNKIQI